jgi:alcohol dehydrogenase
VLGGGDEVEQVLEVTYGGADHVMECVGAASSMDTAVSVCRPGGTVGYVGVPHGVDAAGLELYDFFGDNVTLRGGVAPVRAYAEDLLADVLGGTLDPAPIFTKTVDLAGVPEGYRAMADREALKVLVTL